MGFRKKMSYITVETIMYEFIIEKITKDRTLSLIGEPEHMSDLHNRLLSSGYLVLDKYSQLSPINSKTNFKGDVAIATRPCDFYNEKDVTAQFLCSCRFWEKKFVLIPCTCRFSNKSYEKKLPFYIKRFKNIESIEVINNWIILHNL